MIFPASYSLLLAIESQFQNLSRPVKITSQGSLA